MNISSVGELAERLIRESAGKLAGVLEAAWLGVAL
jgi:hypothetical protein